MKIGGGVMTMKIHVKRIFKMRILFLAATVLLAGFGSGPVSVSADVLSDPRIERILPSRESDLFVVLKNGLTILIRESRSSDCVGCQVMVRTGSIYEGEKTGAGLSHYLEHVVSGGTTSKRTEAEIKQAVQAMGGASNAYTSYDRTAYFINTTKEHYKDALSVLIETVTDCQFNETEYMREKPVILQEFQLGENDPQRVLWYLFMKTAYLRHPVRVPVIGERDVFLQMNKDDLEAYYSRWYTPANLVVTVVGDVDKEDALVELLSLAGSLKETTCPPSFLGDEPGQLFERRVEKSFPIAKVTRVKMGFRTVPLCDPDLYPLDVLAVILGDGRTSALYRAVKDEKELVLSIDASSWTPGFAAGQFLVSMSLDQKDVDPAIDAVWEVLDRIRKRGVDDAALERARKKVAAAHVFAGQSAASQMRRLASDWITAGDPYFSDRYVERINAVTAEDCRDAARKYFRKDALTIAVLTPASDAVSEERADVSLAGEKKYGVIEKRLSNQMTLLLKRNPAVPIVTFYFMSKGGLRFEPADMPGISRFMASLLTKGTRTRTKDEIACEIEDVGGSISSGSGRNAVSVSVSVLKEDFDRALELLADVVMHPVFPEDEIEKQRKDTLAEIERIDEAWVAEIQRLFRRHYYAKHPYRNDSLGTADAIKGIDREKIMEFYQGIIMPNNAVLGVYGDIDPKDAARKVEDVFSDFQPQRMSEPVIEMETENIAEDRLITKTNQKTSAAIFVGYNGLTLYDKERPAADVIDAVLSGIGYPSGWLHDALRGGEQSLVYYVHAYPSYGIDAGYFGAIAQTTPANYDTVLAAIKEKFKLIQEQTIDEETLRRAKSMCITMHEMSLETNGAQARRDVANQLVGLGHDYDQHYAEMIRNVTASDVQRVAKRLFGHALTVTTKPESD